jgi:hypothetical protein
MRRPRISLRTVLLVVAAVAMFLGYSQWRRQHILKQVEEVRQLAGDVNLPNSYFDYLWQRRPTSGHITIGPWADANNVDRSEEARAKLQSMGVTDIATHHLW